MHLYFAPLACSMATRIALYEVGASADYVQVDTKRKQLADGSDFLSINPVGQVPVLRTDEGDLLTENQVILQYVADRFPNTGLALESGLQRYRALQWLSFISSELHKGIYTPLLDPSADEGAKAFARQKAQQRFAYLESHLSGRPSLLDRFSVADAYLTTVLNWTVATDLDLSAYPAIKGYHRSMLQRPSIARAVAEERALYAEEQTRNKAA